MVEMPTILIVLYGCMTSIAFCVFNQKYYHLPERQGTVVWYAFAVESCLASVMTHCHRQCRGVGRISDMGGQIILIEVMHWAWLKCRNRKPPCLRATIQRRIYVRIRVAIVTCRRVQDG